MPALQNVHTIHGRHPDTGGEYIQVYIMTPAGCVFCTTPVLGGDVSGALRLGMEKLEREVQRVASNPGD